MEEDADRQLLPGKYSEIERRQQIQERFPNIHHACTHVVDRCKRDIAIAFGYLHNENTMADPNDNELSNIRQKLRELESEACKVPAGCFTRSYREFLYSCDLLKQLIDTKFKAEEEDRVKEDLTKLIGKCDQLVLKVSSTIHSNLCEKCEIKHI